MADVIEYKIKDTYQEHSQHQSFHNDCSECFKENRVIQAHRLVNMAKHEDLIKQYRGLNNPYGSNYPLGYKPE